MRNVAQRVPDLVRPTCPPRTARRSRRPRRQRRRERGGGERADGGQVDDGHVEVSGRGEHRVERRPDREHSVPRLPRRRRRWSRRSSAVAGVRPRRQRARRRDRRRTSARAAAASTSSGWPGTWIVQPGSVASRATSPGAWCVRPLRHASYDAPMLTEDGADVLVAEVELDLLERALDEERRVGVHDRPHPLEREAGGDPDQQLLADPHVDRPGRVPAGGVARSDRRRCRRARTPTARRRRALAVTPRTARACLGCSRCESSIHAATTSVRPTGSLRRSASLERVVVAPVHRSRRQPSTAKRVCDAAWPAVRRRVVVDDHRRQPVESEPRPRARSPRGWSPRRAPRRRRGRRRADRSALSAARRARRPTAIGSPWPSEPLEISTPGTRFRSGWWPRGESKVPEVREPLDRKEALRGEHRVVRHRAVPLARRKRSRRGIVTARATRSTRSYSTHSTSSVESAARAVLLVAREPRKQTREIRVSERGDIRAPQLHAGTVEHQVHLKSSTMLRCLSCPVN